MGTKVLNLHYRHTASEIFSIIGAPKSSIKI